MKRVFRYCLKAALSGILSVVVLSVFCLYYDNAPYSEEQPSGVTNYRYASDYSWSCMTEGFGFGKTNNIGYNDTQDVTDSSKPVVAFLGSSHTEAFQVPQQSNFVSLTQARLSDDGNADNDFQCLNLGVSSHFLSVTASNLGYLPAYLDNVKYAVIEAHSIQYTVDELQRMLDGAYHTPLKNNDGFSQLLEKIPILRIPFLRSLKKQMDRVGRNAADNESEVAYRVDYAEYEKALEPVLSKLSSTASDGSFQIILLYHHALELNDEAGLVRTDDPQLVQIFKEACERHAIRFIDITDDFIAHYQSTHETPYGFMNTAMAEGHLNTVGHGMISDAVYQQICELEKGN